MCQEYLLFFMDLCICHVIPGVLGLCSLFCYTPGQRSEGIISGVITLGVITLHLHLTIPAFNYLSEVVKKKRQENVLKMSLPA